jgi:DNA invertase Pin-like site-specific DNA recombinase
MSYARVSGLGQVDGDGETRQLEAINKFCLKHQLERVEHFFEKGVTGTQEALDRPAFVDMLTEIERRNKLAEEPGAESLRIDGIVVEHLDRLARDLIVSELLLKECRTRGIKVYPANLDELHDVASNDLDPSRKLFRQITGAIAEWEKSMIVRKLAAARLRKRDKFGRCEGPKPYGEKTGEEMVLKVVREMRQRHNSSSYKIAESLNRRGWLNRERNPWTPQNVRHLIKKVEKTAELADS